MGERVPEWMGVKFAPDHERINQLQRVVTDLCERIAALEATVAALRAGDDDLTSPPEPILSPPAKPSPAAPSPEDGRCPGCNAEAWEPHRVNCWRFIPECPACGTPLGHPHKADCPANVVDRKPASPEDGATPKAEKRCPDPYCSHALRGFTFSDGKVRYVCGCGVSGPRAPSEAEAVEGWNRMLRASPEDAAPAPDIDPEDDMVVESPLTRRFMEEDAAPEPTDEDLEAAWRVAEDFCQCLPPSVAPHQPRERGHLKDCTALSVWPALYSARAEGAAAERERARQTTKAWVPKLRRLLAEVEDLRSLLGEARP